MSIRWGIVGTGGIAGQMATALTRVPDAELVAVASRTAEGAAAFALQHAVPRPYTGLEPLLADPDVDVVYLASPHSEHCPQALLALGAGKNVLVEKPCSLSLAQTTAMVDAAAVAGVFLMEAMWTRFLPAFVRLRALLAAGTLGQLLSVDAAVGFAAPFVPEHRVYRPELGGGALLDLGVYPLQLALLLGQPSTVSATAQLGPTRVDHDTEVRLTFADGSAARTRCSLLEDLPGTARITGTDGWLELAGPSYAPESLAYQRLSEPVVKEDLPFGGDGLRFQVHEVHRCLDAGLRESDVMPWRDSLLLADTLDRVRHDIGLVYP